MSQKRNVILVTFDSLRADASSVIDSESELTPELGQIADSGVVFKNAIAPGPRTATSVPEFLTGTTMGHTSESLEDPAQLAHIEEHIRTHGSFVSRLSDRGYSTVALTANPWTAKQTGVAGEFDQFTRIDRRDDETIVHKPGVRVFSGTSIGTMIYYFECWLRNRGHFAQWPNYFDEILEVIEGVTEPYFIWIFLMDTHNPYIPHPEDRVDSSTLGLYYGLFQGNSQINHKGGQSYLSNDMAPSVERRLRDAYRDTVRSVDRFAGKLVASVQKDNPVMVFHSDHGEAFNEHGTYGHQNFLYEENIHVPLVIKDSEANERIDVSDPISLRKFPELILSYAGETTRPNYHDLTSDYVISRTRSGETIAVRGERWKYIVSDSSEELYDLQEDPGETEDVSRQNTTVCEEMRDRIEAYLETVPAVEKEDLEMTALSPKVEQRLNSLGYK